MTEVQATYYDGRTSRAHAVTLRFTDDRKLVGTGEGVAFEFAAADVEIEPRVANTHRFIRLPNDARCEVTDNDALETVLATWIPRRTSRWIHQVENSWRLALIATLVLSALGWVAVRYGLPAAAKHVAFSLPESFTQALGRDTLRTLDKMVFAPTKLTRERREELEQQIATFLRAIGDDRAYNVVFRSSVSMGANAFALPSGEIVITDALIKLAADDREILGVVAHECGHVVHRHALRTLLQDSAVVVMFAFISGDVSGTAALGGALPAVLLQSKFSREFETEADAQAVVRMRKAGVDPKHLAAILERLTSERHRHGDPGVLDYVSTHPATAARVRAITGEP